jgi:hypothetical protein
MNGDVVHRKNLPGVAMVVSNLGALASSLRVDPVRKIRSII